MEVLDVMDVSGIGWRNKHRDNKKLAAPSQWPHLILQRSSVFYNMSHTQKVSEYTNYSWKFLSLFQSCRPTIPGLQGAASIGSRRTGY